MNTITQGVKVSPVNMEDRKNLGLKAGDTVKVHQKIVDIKGKARIQVFQGTVLARKHGNEPGATFTVRKVASGVGVEKIFPLYSPNIDKIEIVRRSKVRRAKLYFIREKVAREIKRQMRRMQMVTLASESEAEAAARAEEEAKQAEAAEEEAKAAEAAAAEEAAQTEGADATTEDTPAEAAAEETGGEEETTQETDAAEEAASEEKASEAAATDEAEASEDTPAEETTEETTEEETDKKAG